MGAKLADSGARASRCALPASAFRYPLRWSTPVIITALVAMSAEAQQTYEDPVFLVSGDLAIASEYNWRGLTRVNDWVLQPDLYVVVRPGGAGSSLITFSLSAGAWANLELSEVGSGGLADNAEFGFGEVNPWIQVGAGVRDIDLAAGITRYYYTGGAVGRPGARTRSANTTEIYADLRMPGRWLDTRFTWWLDVDRVVGSYFESAATAHIPLFPSFPVPDPTLSVLHLGVVAGWNAGQAPNPGDAAQLSNYEKDGLTHLALSASSPILLAGFSIEPSFNIQWNRDGATRRLGAGAEGSFNVWWGLVVSPVRILGLGRREP